MTIERTKGKARLGIKRLEKEFGPMTMSLFLRSFRESGECTQAEFAERLGISKANLCDLEKGRKLVGVERAVRFAKTLGVPEEGLVQIAFQDLLRASGLRFIVKVSAA